MKELNQHNVAQRQRGDSNSWQLQRKKHRISTQQSQLTSSDLSHVMAPSICALLSSSLAWKLRPMLSGLTVDPESWGSSLDSPVALKAWISLFLMFSRTMVDKVSSLWLSRSMLRGYTNVQAVICCFQPRNTSTFYPGFLSSLPLTTSLSHESALCRSSSSSPRVNRTRQHTFLCFSSAAAIIPAPAWSWTDLFCHCNYGGTVLRLCAPPPTPPPLLLLLLLLLLPVTLIRMVEDLGQRLLLPPKKKPLKRPLQPAPPHPPSFFSPCFSFFSSARPPPIQFQCEKCVCERALILDKVPMCKTCVHVPTHTESITAPSGPVSELVPK